MNTHERWEAVGKHKGACEIIAMLRGKVDGNLLADTLEEFTALNPLNTPSESFKALLKAAEV